MAEYICPHCKKPIYDDEALLCLYCGESLNRGVGFLGGMKYLKPKIIIIFFVSIIVLAFIIAFIK